MNVTASSLIVSTKSHSLAFLVILQFYYCAMLLIVTALGGRLSSFHFTSAINGCWSPHFATISHIVLANFTSLGISNSIYGLIVPSTVSV